MKTMVVNPNNGKKHVFKNLGHAKAVAELARKVSYVSVKKRPKTGSKENPRRGVFILIDCKEEQAAGW